MIECSEVEAGLVIHCPGCRRALTIPDPSPRSDELVGAWGPTPAPPTNSKAIASLGLGLIFFLGCLTGLPAISMGIKALREMNRTVGPTRGRGLAIAGIVLGVFNCLLTVAMLLPLLSSDASSAARRAWCTNNLKQIGLAMHNYVSAQGCLPPAAIADRNGRPLLSWRVLIIPYLDEAATVYANLHLDEPWDSPHNLAFLEKMPTVYACPSDREHPPGMTGYQVIVGPETPFRPDYRPVRFEEITDGTTNTLLVGESRRLVPWTRPDDLSPGMATLPEMGLGGNHVNGSNALFGDGTVRYIKSTIDRRVLQAIFTRDGHEAVDSDAY